MTGRMQEMSATVFQFPLHAVRRERSFEARAAGRTQNVQTIRPILDTDSWYHDEAMREDAHDRRF